MENKNEVVLDLISKWLTHREINKETWVSLGSISRIRNSIWDLNQVDEVERYEIEWENIIFYKNISDAYWDMIKKKFTIPMSELWDIVYSYSREWENLSGKKILRKYNLNRELWQLIKSRLYITKDENACPDIILDYIKSIGGKPAVEEKIVEVSARAMEDKYKPDWQKQHVKLFKQESEKAIKTLKSTESYMELVREYLKDYEPKKYNIPKIKDHKWRNLIVAFGDFHIGRTTDIVIKNLKKLEKKIIEHPAKIITLKNMWDIVETLVQWGMHSWQIEEQDIMGIKQLFDAVDYLKDFMVNIRMAGKIVVMDGVTGNHDRISKVHNEDKFRLWGIVFYELLEKSLTYLTDVAVNYTVEPVFKKITDWLNIIQHHWDNRFDKKRPEDILNFYWEYGVYNIIIQGDKHNSNMIEWKNYTRIGVPSMNTWNRYSEKELMLSAEPGAVFIVANEDGKPDITFIRL